MDELLKAIEELKRAYRESGAKSVKVELVEGDTKCILIDKQKYALENIQKKPITNGKWLRGLSDEELVWLLDWDKVLGEDYDLDISVAQATKALAWLRAEHKGVE